MKMIKMSEAFDFIGGGTPSKKDASFWNGSIPWASVKDMKGDYLYVTQDYISENGLRSSASNMASAGELILVTRILPGKTIVSRIDTSINQDLKIVRPKKNILVKFAHYYFKSIQSDILKKSSGTTVLGITLNNLNEFEFPLISVERQQQIVSQIEELFSEIDKGVEELKTAQQQLKDYKQAVLKWAFEGRLTNEDVRKGELPNSWTIKKVSELSDVVRGGSPRPAGDMKYYNGTIPFLKVADITKDERVYLNSFTYTIKDAGLHKTRSIKRNTLLLSNSGATLGVPKICMIDATINDGIAAFLNLDERSNKYMYYFWKSKTSSLRAINMGAGQPNLNTDIIKNQEVPYCLFDEQQQVVHQIESRLSICDKIQESIIISFQQAEMLRQSILKAAFETEF